MKIVKKIIKSLIFIVLILLLAFNLYNFVSRNILKKDLPTIAGYGVLEVISGSMEPTISIGDLVVIDTKKSDYKISEIITFKDVNGSFVTHRLIDINDDQVITQGDANNAVDEPINKSDVVGVYVTKLDNVGTLFKSLKNPLVMVLIFAIGIVICVIVSTDKSLNPLDISEEDKEFIEYQEQKKKK